MTNEREPMKAVALLSGGLDSTLAIKVVLEQGIAVTALNFTSPFCQCNHKAAADKHSGGGCLSIARNVCGQFGIELKMIPLRQEYLEIVKHPRYGYGKNLNPCIDCRILMLKHAKLFMQEIGASFIITGEVLGQRPLSQHRAAIEKIEKQSGLEGLVVRPLCAKLFPPSIPERNGWIDRGKLLEISGRSRKPQLKLVSEYQIEGYACPAGGCLLTDRGFANRMKDLMQHGDITLDDLPLLKIGRHFRLTLQARLIVGRDEPENNRLLKLAGAGDIVLSPIEIPGPTGIGKGSFDDAAVMLAATIIAKFCDARPDGQVKIECRKPGSEIPETIMAPRISESDLEIYRINKTDASPDGMGKTSSD